MDSTFVFASKLNSIMSEVLSVGKGGGLNLEVGKLRYAIEQLENMEHGLNRERAQIPMADRYAMEKTPREQRFRLRDREKARQHLADRHQQAISACYRRLVKALQQEIKKGKALKLPENVVEAVVELSGNFIEFREDQIQVEKIVQAASRKTVHTKSQVEMMKFVANRGPESRQAANDPVLAVLIMMRVLMILLAGWYESRK